MNDIGPFASHALHLNGPVTNIHEAPAIGNGDLGALVQIFQDEFRLHLGKNDIWDARFDHRAKDGIVTQDDLIRMSRDYGFRLEGGAYSGKPVFDRPPPPGLRYQDHAPGKDAHVFPCPKPAGRIRILHAGTSSTRIRTVVDIRQGLVTADYDMEFGWHGKGRLRIEAFVERNANLIRLRLTQSGLLGAVRLCLEKPPDSLDATLPTPRVRLAGKAGGTVTQRIPAGYGQKAFAWHLAGAFPEPGPAAGARPVRAHLHRLWQACELKSGATVEFTVAVATDRDGAKARGGSLARAQRLAQAARSMDFTQALALQTRAWSTFWARSGIELADKALERCWYRNLFALACQIRPGAMAPGLVGNIVPWETSPWHGCFTVNMNTQKMFLASVPTNHPEWIACYADWLDHLKPGFRYLARLTFGLKGLHAPHMVFPYQPPERQASSNQCGRALGMTGWLGQPLWWHWDCFRDRSFLKKRAYPYFKEAACTAWRYLRKYRDPSGDLYPSLNLEGPPWTRDFKHNRDPFIDLILFRNTFRYALEAARTLKTDAAWRKRWAWGLAQIRPVRVERLAGGGHWIYADKNDSPGNPDNWRGPRQVEAGQCVAAAWTVFPGEVVAGDEPDGLAPALRDIMRRNRWTRWHPEMIWIHHWWCAIPALRMRLPEAFAMARKIILRERFPAGHARTTHWIHLTPDAWRVPEENYLAAAGVAEMLLQSQDGVIRLFPAWPAKKRASFRGLPARGGFLVDAEHSKDGPLTARIRSLANGTCRIQWPSRFPPRLTCAGRKVAFTRTGDTLAFQTKKGKTYCLVSFPGECLPGRFQPGKSSDR